MPAVATDADDAGATYYVNGTSGSDTDDGSEKTPFKTIAKALEKDDVSKIILKSNVTEYVTIAEGKDVELDLNGFKLTNSNDTVDNKSVILNNGALTISDSSAKTGEINANNKKVAISNAGILEIKGGKFTNTLKDDYVNYLLNNNGTVTINGGSFVMADPMGNTNSSIVKNGWNEPSSSSVAVNDVVKWEAGKTATMTINDGEFKGPTYVKNDSYGVMTINSGSFITTATTKDWSGNCVFNGAKLTVNDGTFNNTASTKAGAPFYVGGDVVASETVINGGTYIINDKYLDETNPAPLIRIVGDNVNQDLSIEVSANVANELGEHPVIRTVIGILGDAKISVGSNSVNLPYNTNNATFTYDKVGCLKIDTLTIGGNSYFGGNVSVKTLTFSNKSLIVEKGAVVTTESDLSSKKNEIVNVGGTIKDKNGVITGTNTEAIASNFADLKNMLDAGIPTIKAQGNPVLKENIVIKSGTTLDVDCNCLYIETYTISVNGGTIKGTIRSGDSSSSYEDVYFDNVTGEFTVFKGNSIDIDATKIQGTVTVTSGATEISGKITGDLTITTTNASDVVKFSDVTVNSGVKLTLSGPGEFSVVAGKTFNLYGSLVNGNPVVSPATSPASIDIDVKKDGEAKATFKAYSGSQIAGTILIKGDGTIDLSKAQNPQTVGEDISYDKVYGQLENVTIVGNLTIKNNSTVTVKGGFQVNEGVTLTIEKGSTLLIDSSAASMIVAGRIIVEEGATLEVKNAKDVQVSGSIESEGTVVIDSKVTIKSGGSITINDGTVAKPTVGATTAAGVKELYRSVFEPKQGLIVEAGATLTVRSLMYSATAMNIDNKGTVVFDKAIIGTSATSAVNVTVNMLADGAVVEVLSIENIATNVDTTGKATAWQSNSLVIKDLGLVFVDKTKVEVGKENTVTIAPLGYAFKGLTVVEKVSSSTVNGQTTYYNTLDLAGTVSLTVADSVTLTATQNVITVTGDRVAVTGELALGKYVGFTVNGKLSVSGTLTATEDKSNVTIGTDGEITVYGLIQKIAPAIDSKINAAMYESKIGTTTIYNYTTLKAAVDSGAKDITVTGSVYVSETLTVPAGVTVKNNGTIIVGSDDSTDVVLTFADGASVKYGTIDVYGTLVFDNKKDNKAGEILSDVSVIGDVSAKYTNLFTALSEAQSGDTVTVDREIVELKKSITIKEGVTLDLPSSKVLKVFAGVTITVNGTLRTAEKIETDAGVTFDLAADKLNSKAAIIVNGVFMSMSPVQYDGAVTKYMIPGAYYSLSDSVGAYNYVTTLENASKSDAVAVSVYGKVSAGDIAFTGTETAPKTVTVAAGADLTVASIALDKADLAVDGRISGDVKVGDSAVSVKNVRIVVSIDKDGHMVVETVSKNVTGTETASFKVSAGSIHIRSASMDVTVASGAALASDSDPTTLKEKLTIEGIVSVANEQTIIVKKDVVVKGTLSVADATDSKIAGTFKVEAKLYIGLTSKDIVATADAASVSGAIAGVSVAFVKADATVSDATIESFKNAEGKLVSTTYVVEGKDWMTVYDRTGGYTIKSVTNAPVTDAQFKGWKNTKGDDVEATDKIGAKNCDKVTADIEYDIYQIYITPCAGIESIAIDGNLIQTSILSSVGGLLVKAGAHTITYSLANGYSGEAKLSMVKSGDKTAASVSGMTFTVSGGAGDVYLQLTGIEKSGYVDPTPVTPSDDGKDGLSLTDYLLIVLVVLIVIMAVIVAMRLMRS